MEWVVAVASFPLVTLFPSLLLWLTGRARVERKRSGRGIYP